MNILDGLNEKQREAVTHTDGPLLVIAGPGTGKTKVITHRIAYLINEYKVVPEKILAITFTNKAAQEMQERVNKEISIRYGSRVNICTFHTFCHKVLRRQVSKEEAHYEIGLHEDFTILNQEDQGNLLTEIVQELNFNPSNYRPWRLLNIISNLKGNLQELTETLELSENDIRITDEEDVTKIGRILETYQSKLEERNLLDFDDLLFKTVKLFEKFSDIRETYHQEISHILVDEYHDVNKAQYQLLQLLSASSEQNLMAVADSDQAIYSWRGSKPEYIDLFKTDFTPHTVGLEQHYRCTQTILSAAKEIISEIRDPNRPSLKTDKPIGEKEEIVHCIFSEADEVEEAKRIIGLVRNIKRESRTNPENNRQPDKIAILYRNHKFANVLTEQLALQNDTPFRRWIQSTNSFQEDYRQAIVSYLNLVESETSPDVEHAINFPETSLDGLTLRQLKRIARREKIGLAELLRDIEAYPQTVGPLTRANIRRFWEQIHKFVAEVKIGNAKASRIISKLLDMLEHSRSPYRSEELEIIEKNRSKVQNITVAQDVLHRAIESGERIHIIASYGIDEYCASHILRQTLETYLNQTVQAQFLLPDAPQPQLTDKGIYLLIGDFDELERHNDTHIFLIGTTNNRNADVIQLKQTSNSEESPNTNTARSITTLKFCQGLIRRFEIHNMEDIVIYDLETTGVNIETANIVEIAAHRLNASGDKVDEYHQLVKPPDGYIPQESTDIHKISMKDVEGKPGIASVLPQFWDFIQDSVLVGHNISQYDNPILERDMKEHLDTDLTNLYYDTLVAARKLFPHKRQNLGALANEFGILDRLKIKPAELHSAGNDVKVNREVFKELIATDSREREVKSLTEFLPFVGLGILAKIETSQIEVSDTMDMNAATADRALTEIDVFLNAAKRFVQTHSSQNYMVNSPLQVDLLLEQNEKRQIGVFMSELRRSKIPNSAEDIEWKEERANMIKSVRRFEEISGDYQLRSFINYKTRMINAVLNFEKVGDERDSIRKQMRMDNVAEQLTLMSLHMAKGTEFDVVIIVGMEEGSFPRIWNWTSEAIEEEERRLFYVGMTRAKRRLYLSTSMYRFYENQSEGFSHTPYATYSPEDQDRAASRFIGEIPPDYIQKWPPQE